MISDIDKKHIEAFLFRVAGEIVNDAKDLAPIGPDRIVNNTEIQGGNLQADIKVWNDNISSLEIEVGNSDITPYAIFVHEGTKPHIIRPKNKKGLANKKTGAFFGKEVHHPGTKANPYLKKAVDNYNFNPALDDLGNKICEDVFENIKKGFNK